MQKIANDPHSNQYIVKACGFLSLFFLLYVFCSFLYYGTITPPGLGDSHDYHVPIAESYLSGQFLSLPKNINSYINYPGMSEIFLVPFIVFHLPLNWFCLLGWGILVFLLIKLGRHFGLSNALSIIFATTFSLTYSVLRQIPTQSIDIWMAVWFVGLILLLERPKTTIKYFLFLGILFGILIGSKYSGPLYAIVLGIIYLKKFKPLISPKNMLAFMIPIILLGIFWYIRNYLSWGTPIYPGSLLFMKGIPGLDLPNYMLWKIIPTTNLFSFLEAFISEFLIWAFSIPLAILFIVMNYKKRKQKNMAELVRLLLLSFLVLLSSLVLSFKPTFEASNMRYLFQLIIPFTLIIFLLGKRYHVEKEVALIATANAAVALNYLSYHPKLIVLCLGLSAVIYITKKNALSAFLEK
ncbi:MAG: hypothetical protein HZC02_05445 [Candidatus Levybacteria bacterium]|nr:hypothetical protein [Candidatus Levybacteria bacterium]